MVKELGFLEEATTPFALDFGQVDLLPVVALKSLICGENHHTPKENRFCVHQIAQRVFLLCAIEQAHFQVSSQTQNPSHFVQDFYIMLSGLRGSPLGEICFKKRKSIIFSALKLEAIAIAIRLEACKPSCLQFMLAWLGEAKDLVAPLKHCGSRAHHQRRALDLSCSHFANWLTV